MGEGNFHSHLFGLYTILIGLGIAEILKGWMRSPPNRDRIRESWDLFLWTILAYLSYVQEWYGIYQYKNALTTFLHYFYFLLNPVLLYIAVGIVFDAFKLAETKENREEVQGKIRFICAVCLFIPIFDILNSVVFQVRKEELFGIENLIRSIAAVLLAIGICVKSKVFHTILVILLLGLLITFIFFDQHKTNSKRNQEDTKASMGLVLITPPNNIFGDTECPPIRQKSLITSYLEVSQNVSDQNLNFS